MNMSQRIMEAQKRELSRLQVAGLANEGKICIERIRLEAKNGSTT